VGEGYDIGIRGGRARDSSLVSRRVCALPMVLLASPVYLSRRGTPRTADDLVRHELIGVRFADGHSATWKLRPSPRKPAVDWSPTARAWVSDPEAQLDLARAGAGIVQVALHHAASDLAACVFRLIVTGQSGIVTADSGIVTARSGIVTEGGLEGVEGCV